MSAFMVRIFNFLWPIVQEVPVEDPPTIMLMITVQPDEVPHQLMLAVVKMKELRVLSATSGEQMFQDLDELILQFEQATGAVKQAQSRYKENETVP